VPTVVVDTEEWKTTGERIAAKLEQLGLRVVVRDLDVSNYLVEREGRAVPLLRLYYKKFLELIASREIFNSIYKLIDTGGLIVVELEEFSEIDESLYAYRNALEVALKSAMKYGVPVVFAHSLITPLIIYYLASEDLSSKKKEEKKIYTSDAQEIALSVLMKIPSVGPKTAARLLAAFKSLKNIANADVEDLLRVEGLGKQRAKLIYEVFNVEFE
jgi:Fanconi anemia group M protein